MRLEARWGIAVALLAALIAAYTASAHAVFMPPIGGEVGFVYLNAKGTAYGLGHRTAMPCSVEAVGLIGQILPLKAEMGERAFSPGFISFEYVSVSVDGEAHEFTTAYGRLGRRALVIIAREPAFRALEGGRNLPVRPTAFMILIARLQGEPGEETPVKCIGLLLVRGAGRPSIWLMRLEGTLTVVKETIEGWRVVVPQGNQSQWSPWP